MLSGLGLPLHAYAQHGRASGPGSDFCTAGQPGKSAPAAPAREHGTACDMCCGCTTDGAASGSMTRAAMVPAAFVAVSDLGIPTRSTARFGSALPRGPPLLS